MIFENQTKRMRIALAAGSTAVCLSIIPAIANAGLTSIGTADVTFSNPIFTDTGSDTVQIYYPNQNGDERSMRVSAGRFSGSATADGFNADLFYENADLVHLYCIDLYQRIGSGWNGSFGVHQLDANTPNILTNDAHPQRDFDRTLDFLGALNYTLANDYRHLGFGESNYNWLNPTNAWMSGAIQLGIWESLYEDVGEETVNWDISTGDFRVSDSERQSYSIHADGASLLSRTFANIQRTESLGTEYALVLTSDQYQDMIVGDPPIDVPVPATAALLIFGCGLIRRRKAAA